MKLAIEKARADIRGEGFSKATQGVRVSIHSGESQRFMRQVLQGGEWVQRVMKQGLYPAFQQEPGRYREKNNRSALQNLSVVRSKVAEWLNQGAVMQLAEPGLVHQPAFGGNQEGYNYRPGQTSGGSGFELPRKQVRGKVHSEDGRLGGYRRTAKTRRLHDSF